MLTMFGIAWGIISIPVMVAACEGLGVGIQKTRKLFWQGRDDVFAGRTIMQAGGDALRREPLGRRRLRVFSGA